MAIQRHQRDSSAAALAYIDYAYPFATVLYFAFASTYSLCLLQKAKSSRRLTKLRYAALALLGSVVLSYIGQGALYIIRAFAQKGWWAEEYDFIQVLSAVLVWTGFFIYLVKNSTFLWHPLLGIWILALGFEATICGLSSTAIEGRSVFDKIRFAFILLRITLFTATVAVGLLAVIAPNDEKATDEEREPLIKANGSANGQAPETTNGQATEPVDGSANGTANGTVYGTLPASPSTSDSPKPADDENKEIKEQQSKRLEEAGGWWGYLKAFFVFLPLMWPKGNYKLQFCIFIMGATLVVDRFLNVLVPQQVGVITDALAERQGTGRYPIKELGIWFFLRYLQSGAGYSIAKDIAQVQVQNYARAKISDLAFSHVMGLSMDFHGDKDSGEVIRSMQQAQSLNEMLELVLMDISPVFIDLIVAIAYVTHLFDAYVGFVLIVVGVVYTWLGVTLTQWTRPKRQIMRDKDRAESKTMYETVSNWQTVAYFNRRNHEQARYNKTVEEAVSAENYYYIIMNLSWAAQSLVMLGGLLVAVTLATRQIIYGTKPVGNFVILILYWRQLMYPLHLVATSYRRISSNLIDAERLLQLLNTKSSVQDKENAKDLEVGPGKVEFINVDFAYDDRKQTLHDINFTAESGKTIAFVGETGGGKSTTLKLLFRFYDVKSGRIEIDGQDIRDVSLESLRESLGVVPQDPSLFNQSIRDNVRYARLDATDEEIEEACKAAAVHDKIMTFPEKYDSKVGERGVKLSGGELQRVAIARVLLKGPKIVLLDEATSAVDSSTETQIQDAFRKLSEGRTTFVIAHRLSTIMDADLILVIDQGKIVQRGTHTELLTQEDGKYKELWTKQTEKRKTPPATIAEVESGETTRKNSDDLKDDLLLFDDTEPGSEIGKELKKVMTGEVEPADGKPTAPDAAAEGTGTATSSTESEAKGIGKP